MNALLSKGEQDSSIYLVHGPINILINDRYTTYSIFITESIVYAILYTGSGKQNEGKTVIYDQAVIHYVYSYTPANYFGVIMYSPMRSKNKSGVNKVIRTVGILTCC